MPKTTANPQQLRPAIRIGLQLLERSGEPNPSVLDALKTILSEMQAIECVLLPQRIEILLAVQRTIANCVESNQCTDFILKWSEAIVDTLQRIPSQPQPDAKPSAGDQQPPAADGAPKLKTCRKLLEQIVLALKAKWKTERQLGYPALKGGKNSASAKNLLKSMGKYEAYIVKALWARWMAFEKKTERVRDVAELQNVLSSTHAFFKRSLDTLQREQPKAVAKKSKPKTPTKKRQSEPSCPATKPAEDHDRMTDIFISSTYKSDSMADIPSSGSPSAPNPTSSDGIVCMCIFEPPHPNIAYAQATIKYFRDTGTLEMLEIQAPTGAASIDDQPPARPVVCNDRWPPIKRNLIDKGVLTANGLHISLPVHRREFLIGSGQFGQLEFAFDGQFTAIALKRLTQSGHVGAARCDSIRRALDDCAQSESVRTSPHLLASIGLQDMCGYSFCYAPVCEYNLAEYVARLVATNAEPMLSAGQVVQIMRQVVQGLGALHLARSPIVHGNLKPSNVLVSGEGRVMLAEFGVSTWLYDRPEEIGPGDKIWWAEEVHSWLKVLNSYSCSTMSDIFACGKLFLFVSTGGCFPSVERPLSAAELLDQEKDTISLEMYHLLEQMLHSDPVQRPAIIEVHNHIYFWPARRRSQFLQTCISVANTDYAPFYVERQVAHAFCSTLAAIWSKDGTKLFWLPAAQQHYAHIEAPFGAEVDSALGLLRFLAKCKHDDAELFGRAGLMARAYPELVSLVYNALRTTNWFEHERFRAFSPSRDWMPTRRTEVAVKERATGDEQEQEVDNDGFDRGM